METFRAVAPGHVPLLPLHLSRLARSAFRLGGISLPDEMLADLSRSLVAHSPEGVGRLVLTWSEVGDVDLLLETGRPSPVPQEWRAVLYPRPRPVWPSLTAHKHVFLQALMAPARAHAARTGADEALLFTPEGILSEGTRTNVFLVYSHRILTPARRWGALPGVARSALLRAGSLLGQEITVGEVRAGDLARCQGMFLTNGTVGAVAVTRWEGRDLPDTGHAAAARQLLFPAPQ